MYIAELTEAGRVVLDEWNTKVENDYEITEEEDVQVYAPLSFVSGELFGWGITTPIDTMESLVEAIKDAIKEEGWNHELYDGTWLKEEWFEFEDCQMDVEYEDMSNDIFA